MITVIIQGTKDIQSTLKSLKANAVGEFRVLVDPSVVSDIDVSFITSEELESGESDLYWQIPSGVLILSASWDKRFEFCFKTDEIYCLYPAYGQKYPATNLKHNINKWEGEKYLVPILGVTEV